MSDHSVFSPSGSAKWINCPGSLNMEKDIPNESSEAASHGTAAHELADRCMVYQKPASFFLGEQITADGIKFDVDDEMVLAVQMYLDYCNALEGQHEWFEKKVHFEKWVPGGYGKSDYTKIQVLYPEESHVEHHVINVVDLKYGKGVKVYADHNSQAMIYSLGALETYSYMFDFQDSDIVNCAIVQPRLDHIDEFKISVGKLKEWARKTLLPAVEEANKENPACHAGWWCDKGFCRARTVCTTLSEFHLKTVSEDFKVIGEDFTLRDTSQLSNQDLSWLLKRTEGIVSWANGLKSKAFEELNAGRSVPDFKLVQGKKKNKAFKEKDETKLEASLIELGLEREEVITEQIKTPTQIEKTVKVKKLDEEKYKEFWVQADGDPTIAKASDPKPAIKSEVEQHFDIIATS